MQDAALLSRLLKFLASSVHDGEISIANGVWLTQCILKHLLKLLHPNTDLDSLPPDESSTPTSFARELRCDILRVTACTFEIPFAHKIWSRERASECILAMMPHLNLGNVGVDHVYDLHLLALTLQCVSSFTSPAVNGCDKLSTQNLHTMATQLVDIANTSFSGDPEGGSFVGKRLCELALMSIRHISFTLKTRSLTTKKGADGGSSNTPTASDLSHDLDHAVYWGPHWLQKDSVAWLGKLFLDREPVIRAQALGVVADFVSCPEAAGIVENVQFAVRDGSLPLFDAMFAVLFDATECILVRSAAANVLVRLTMTTTHNNLKGNSEFEKDNYAGSRFSNFVSMANDVDLKGVGANPGSMPAHAHVTAKHRTNDDVYMMFEDNAFFDNASSLLYENEGSLYIAESVALLCHNLLLLKPDSVPDQFERFDIWRGLIRVMQQLVPANPDTTKPTANLFKSCSAMTALANCIYCGLALDTPASMETGTAARDTVGGLRGHVSGSKRPHKHTRLGESSRSRGKRPSAQCIAKILMAWPGFVRSVLNMMCGTLEDQRLAQDTKLAAEVAECGITTLALLIQLLKTSTDSAVFVWASVVEDPTLLLRLLDVAIGSAVQLDAAMDKSHSRIRIACLNLLITLFGVRSTGEVAGRQSASLDCPVIITRGTSTNDMRRETTGPQELEQLAMSALHASTNLSEATASTQALGSRHTLAGTAATVGIGAVLGQTAGSAFSAANPTFVTAGGKVPLGRVLGSTLVKWLACRFGQSTSDDSNADCGGRACSRAAKGVLRSLLGVSSSAKLAALDTGLVGLAVTTLRATYADMCIEGLDKPGPRGMSRNYHQQRSTHQKHSTCVWEMQNVLGTLANVLHNCSTAKEAALQTTLLDTLQLLWGTCALDSTLLQGLVQVLSNVVADCPAAIDVLAETASSKSSIVRKGPKLICRLFRTNSNDAILGQLLRFLSCLVSNTQCRAVFWREGLIEECLVQLTVLRKQKADVVTFLAAASYSKDVQTSMCRSTKMLSAIFESSLVSSIKQQRTATQIIRNVCFLRQSRSFVVGNARFMSVLRALAQSEDEPTRSTAQEGLWCLLRNSNKTDRRRMWPDLSQVLQPTDRGQAQTLVHSAGRSPVPAHSNPMV